MSPENKNKLLRIGEVADILNCNKRQVYYLISEGILSALSIGVKKKKGLRVKGSVLESFIEKRAREFEEENGTSLR